MPPAVYSTTSVLELEQFMSQQLCEHERLDSEQVKKRRSVMRQGNEITGLIMRIEGPRLMRSQAIWAARENRILFYDSAGQRFAVVKLAESPELVAAAA
ncbi:MAG: hypothetical protein U0796_22380 [Gemmatales bacterium]